jgi:hypothetical protein
VRRGVVTGDRPVAAAAYDFAADYYDGSYRDFSLILALAGQTEGFTEELLVNGGNASPP